MIALNIHRPEPTCGKNKVSMLVFFFSTLTKLGEKNPSVYFSCWVVRRKGQEAKGLPLRRCCKRADLTCGRPLWGMSAPVGVGRAGWTARWNGLAPAPRWQELQLGAPPDEAPPGSIHPTECPRGHCPVEVQTSFNVCEYYVWLKGFVSVRTFPRTCL